MSREIPQKWDDKNNPNMEVITESGQGHQQPTSQFMVNDNNSRRLMIVNDGWLMVADAFDQSGLDVN